MINNFEDLMGMWHARAQICRQDAERLCPRSGDSDGPLAGIARELLRDAAQYEQSIFQVKSVLERIANADA